ncbi:NAD(P)-binding protein [Coniophora puteana RWD-64-598 SS2]|uniref:NAD(P)-binding protein n=1 Tax=Coniophora puteana (strain RWD-64-598) TaxID=741705 RepID=A0A5M3MUA0_CONPW|nr:NAD(P)-binding protein [Coniophora puteana RWD-64-598 SS2]EIW82693.1 NAD(P)-binding protein [Coniophora puteana RWD-64-598 SS2]
MFSKVWFITGASTGFGRSVTELALRKGDKVVATMRSPKVLSELSAKYPASQLLVSRLDVTNSQKITSVFDEACAKFGRVDVVFNNAGHCTVSEAEGMSESSARRLFEVLFWGAANVTKEAVRVFRDANQPRGGHLVQMSSRTALEVVPGVAHYAAAKSALETLTEGYKAELDPTWGIKMSIIEPALFRTGCVPRNIIEPVHPAYSDPSLPSRKYRSIYPGADQFSDGDSNKLAQAIYRLTCMDDPPFRLPLHHVAVSAARKKGLNFIQVADKFASWSNDIYLDDADIAAAGVTR